MTRSGIPFRVACIGSVAVVAMWKLAEELAPAVRRGFLQSTLLGNDAVIVAGELAQRDHEVHCVVLAPTEEDVRTVRERLPTCRVTAIDPVAGALTHTLCLEAEDGRRSWVFPRIPVVGSDPPEIDADAVYIDYYPEFRSYVGSHLGAWYRGEGSLMINLSDYSPTGPIPEMGFQPTIVQASVDVDPEQARDIADRIREQTDAELTIVTSGRTGAAFSTSRSSVHLRPSVQRGDGSSVLGSGAVFSAAVVEAVLELGTQDDRLPRQVMARTSERLPFLREHAHSRS